MTDIRELDVRALRITESIVHQVDAGRLDRPTPCGQWTLRQLLAHMTGQNHGSAAAARGETRDREVWACFGCPGTSDGPTEAINGRLEHLRGFVLGFPSLPDRMARSLPETGGFRPHLPFQA